MTSMATIGRSFGWIPRSRSRSAWQPQRSRRVRLVRSESCADGRRWMKDRSRLARPAVKLHARFRGALARAVSVEQGLSQ